MRDSELIRGSLTKDISQDDIASATLGAAGLIEGILSVADKSNPLLFAGVGITTLGNDLRKIEISSTTNGTIAKSDLLSARVGRNNQRALRRI